MAALQAVTTRGRPSNATKAAMEQAAKGGKHDAFGGVDEALVANKSTAIDFNKSRAAVEAVKAKQAELLYRVTLGKYVDREAIQRASALVMAQFAQGMRSMQDDMERKLALTPELAEAIGKYVDDQLDQLASEFELMLGAKDE